MIGRQDNEDSLRDDYNRGEQQDRVDNMDSDTAHGWVPSGNVGEQQQQDEHDNPSQK